MTLIRALAAAASAVCLLPGASLPAAAQLAETIAKVKPAIVVVGSWRATDNPRLSFRGTGFVVGDGRRVLTNAHVLPEATETEAEAPMAVAVPRGRGEAAEVRRARLLALDRRHDLALLAIDGAPLRALTLSSAATLAEGSDVAFTGFPLGNALGFFAATHRGTVAAITPMTLPAPAAQRLTNQAIRQLREPPFDLYQLDATAYPGNSGSPVYEPASGEVVGVLNMVLLKAGHESALSQPSGISYAIPIVHARELMQRAPAQAPGAPAPGGPVSGTLVTPPPLPAPAASAPQAPGPEATPQRR